MRPLIAAFACLAAPALAQDMSPNATKLAEAIENGDCVVTLANGNDLAADSGLSNDEVTAATVELFELGLLALNADGASASLSTPACQ